MTPLCLKRFMPDVSWSRHFVAVSQTTPGCLDAAEFPVRLAALPVEFRRTQADQDGVRALRGVEV